MDERPAAAAAAAAAGGLSLAFQKATSAELAVRTRSERRRGIQTVLSALQIRKFIQPRSESELNLHLVRPFAFD